MLARQYTNEVAVGHITIGGDAPVSVQSMTNTPTRQIEKTVSQIHALEKAGCEIIRLAISCEEDAKAIYEIKERTTSPLVADIHFDYALALLCIERGIDKVRINPGNIGGEDRVRKVARAAKEKNIPIRIGVNAGSIGRDILEKYGEATPEAMVESAVFEARLLEKEGMDKIVLSLKASDVTRTFEAYHLISQREKYPLHLGITEAGGEYSGLVKSSVGIGALLLCGIGNTIRVSLTADPVLEVKAAREILKAAGLNKKGINIISCPTCGRCGYDLIGVAKQVEQRLIDIHKDLTVAIMGCGVNGPGEAKAADIGIAGGEGKGVLFKKGRIIKTVPEEKMVEVLVEEILKHE